MFILYWSVRLKRQVILSIIVIAIGYYPLQRFIQFGNNAENHEEEQAIKIMSWNVRLFDLYNWTENKDTRDKMFNFLEQEDADIYCFQEFYYREDKVTWRFETRDTLVQFLRAKNYHEGYSHYFQRQHFGVFTLSSYPIVNKGAITFNNDKNNICIYTDFKRKDDTVRVYNAHLSSIRFDVNDYEFLANLGEQKDSEKLERGGKKVLVRLKKAFIKRASQANEVAEHIKKSPYPVILAGDFNDTPWSYAYKILSDGLCDAFQKKGSGLGTTYASKIPSYRIDYLLYSEKIKCTNFETKKLPYSDHYPVVGIFEVNN